MINLLLHSGLLNATFWAAVLGLALVLLARRRGPVSASTPDLSRWTLVIAILGIGALAADLFGMYKGYVLPLDIMQDIVSAQELLEGRSLYPPDMSKRIQESLDREPEPFSLSRWWPALREKELEAREEARTLHWVQAHPPFMTVFFTPFVMCLGVTGTIAALSLLSLIALFWSFTMLQRGLELSLSRRQSIMLVLAVLGWAPVANVLRTGQTGLLLTGLIIGGWSSLRRGRSTLAGVAIGVATCLKLFPALLLGYLLLRHRRAFLSAALTIAVLLTATGIIAGWDAYREHFATGHGVVEDYAARNNNLSLLGVVTRAVGSSTGNLADAQAIFLAGAMLLIAAAAWLVFRSAGKAGLTREQMDLEYSLFVALMPLLSPITWDHYLVILLLPLAVLGRRTLLSSSNGARIAWLSLVVILAIPETTFYWMSPLVKDHLGVICDSILFQSLRTAAMLGTCVWLGTLIHVVQNSGDNPDPRGESSSNGKSRTSALVESIPSA